MQCECHIIMSEKSLYLLTHSGRESLQSTPLPWTSHRLVVEPIRRYLKDRSKVNLESYLVYSNSNWTQGFEQIQFYSSFQNKTMDVLLTTNYH